MCVLSTRGYKASWLLSPPAGDLRAPCPKQTPCLGDLWASLVASAGTGFSQDEGQLLHLPGNRLEGMRDGILASSYISCLFWDENASLVEGRKLDFQLIHNPASCPFYHPIAPFCFKEDTKNATVMEEFTQRETCLQNPCFVFFVFPHPSHQGFLHPCWTDGAFLTPCFITLAVLAIKMSNPALNLWLVEMCSELSSFRGVHSPEQQTAWMNCALCQIPGPRNLPVKWFLVSLVSQLII